MEEQIKRFFFTGIGLVSLSLESIRDSVEELIRNKKISQEEGQRIIADFLAVTRPKRDEFEKQLQQVINQPQSHEGSGYQEEILHLRNRISELETRMGQERQPHKSRQQVFNQRQQIPLVQEAEDVSDKVLRGERASFKDSPLTPEKKINIELRRMQNPDRDPMMRSDPDNQRATLGGPILTPEKKVQQDNHQRENRKKDPDTE